MSQHFLAPLYDAFPLPVVVFEHTSACRPVYMNTRAELMFAPTHSVDEIGGEHALPPLRELLHFSTHEEETAFFYLLQNSETLEFYPCALTTFDGQVVEAAALGNRVDGEPGQPGLFVLYFKLRADTGEDYSLPSVIHAAFLAAGVEGSIQTVLALAGQMMGVSRSYIFEPVSATTTANTYEWCAEGVAPAIDGLQSLRKEDYNYDIIMNAGMYVTDDVRVLPDVDREILERQGIKSLAIIPMFDGNLPLGYVGFDDTEKYRTWSHREIQFLQSISVLLATFIKRRDAERGARHSQNVLQLISENSEDIIYVNDLEDYTLKFVSRALADSLGSTPESLLGKRCWEVLQADQDGPCAFCPIPKIQLPKGADRSETYQWEFQNLRTGSTYLAKDNILRWVDQRYVHVETAYDISGRKENEDRLQYLASTDTMTGACKREWGTRLFEERLREWPCEASLCFLDVDGLKRVNDTLGHTAGDDFLAETARVIRGHLGKDDILCRWGGDEFLLWMARPEGIAGEAVQAMQQEMDRINAGNSKPFTMAFSYGIVAVPAGSASLDALVTEADTRMYRDKMAKRGKLQRRRRDD